LIVAAVALLAIPDESPPILEYGSAPPPASSPAPGVRPAPDRGPRTAARRFLSDYLRYVHGRSGLPVRAATRALSAQLAASPLRVPPGARSHRPRVVGIDCHRFGNVAAVTAQVKDGAVRYPVGLTIEQRGGRWLVASVGAD
jgi:hypothetical protein